MGASPSTKETSLHHFRDPIVSLLAEEPEIDFLGIIVMGTPQDNARKHLVGQRTAAMLEGMRANGVVAVTDGWGNAEVDFANTIQEIGERGISLVGLKFIGQQAKFIVENDYTGNIFDINKTESGFETEMVGENAIDEKDASKIVAAIKLMMRKDKQIPR